MDDALSSALGIWRRFTITRYLVASIIALVCDVLLFLQFLQLQIPVPVASALSYSIGILVHWVLSSRVVFKGRVMVDRRERSFQKTQFVVSALIGLGLTTVLVTGGSLLGLGLPLAKLIAVGASFVVVWYIRHRFIFSTR